MTYGHRRKPLGNQARISSDEGKTWSDAMTIYGDGISGDLGYPSTVECKDGSMLTVWYERVKGSANAVLRQVTWNLK
jgi:sialidase-1